MLCQVFILLNLKKSLQIYNKVVHGGQIFIVIYTLIMYNTIVRKDKNMKKIVCFNQKGGTGKSTSVVNICGCLDVEKNKKCLVLDCDSQMNSTSYLTTYQGLDSETSIVECLNNQKISDTDIIPVNTFYKREIATKISLIPASKEIDYLDFEDLSVLSKLLEEYESKYDYCFFDCPPHLSNLTLMALASADYVLIPALADTDSLGGYDSLIDTINGIRSSGLNLKIKILGIFFNNVESNKALDKYILDNFTSNMNENVFKTYIKRTSLIPQARFYGKPIAYYKPSSDCEKNYLKLVNEMIRRINKLEKEK